MADLMHGLMQDYPLTVESILRRGETFYPTRTITTRTADGGLDRAAMSAIE